MSSFEQEYLNFDNAIRRWEANGRINKLVDNPPGETIDPSQWVGITEWGNNPRLQYHDGYQHTNSDASGCLGTVGAIFLRLTGLLMLFIFLVTIFWR